MTTIDAGPNLVPDDREVGVLCLGVAWGSADCCRLSMMAILRWEAYVWDSLGGRSLMLRIGDCEFEPEFVELDS